MNRLQNTRTCEVNITGSSAKLLVKEIATEFGGRSLPWELFPFSFREYLETKDDSGRFLDIRRITADQARICRKYLKEYEKILIKERIDTDKPEHTIFLNMCELNAVVLNANITGVNSIRYSTSIHDAVSKYVLRYNNLLEGVFRWSEKYKKEVEALLDVAGVEDGFAVEVAPLIEPYKSYLLKTHLPDMIFQRFKMLKERISALDKNIKSKKLQEEDLINLL